MISKEYKELNKMGIIEKIFGTHSEHELKRIYPIVDHIDALEPEMQKLSDEELKEKTKEFKERLAKGETLDDLLPEAFAVVREAAVRVLGMRHYRVQMIGGIILHQGRIAEMKTGEGKTLVSTLPAYLNALTGEGVHIVTAVSYTHLDGTDQHLCTCIRISFRSRDVIQDGLKQRNHVFRFIVDIVSCISVSCRSKKDREVKLFVRCAQIDEKFKNFIDNFIRTCFRTVDLVDTYDNRELQCKSFFQNKFGLWHGTFKSVNQKNHSIDPVSYTHLSCASVAVPFVTTSCMALVRSAAVVSLITVWLSGLELSIRTLPS